MECSSFYPVTLPNEILFRIISSPESNINDPKTLGVIALVCKQWNEVINDPYFWKNECKKINLFHPSDIEYLAAIKNGPKLTSKSFVPEIIAKFIKPEVRYLRGRPPPTETEIRELNKLKLINPCDVRDMERKVSNELNWKAVFISEFSYRKLLLKKNDICANQHFIKDKDLMMALVSKSRNWAVHAFVSADPALQNDRDFQLAFIKTNEYALYDIFLKFPKLKEDRDFILDAVRQCGDAIKFANEFRYDKEIALEAVTCTGWAIVHINSESQDYWDIALRAVTHDPTAILVVNSKFRKNRDFVLKAVSLNGLALQYVDNGQDTEFQKDSEIVHAALKQNDKALQFAEQELEKKKETPKVSRCQIQ